jgi:hypothetical protein
MANRLSKEKAGLIASNYCTNGFKKVQALLDSGYKTSYATSAVGLRLYDNIKVKEAIACIEARNAASATMTVDKVQSLYQAAYDLAEETKQSSSMVSAATGIARLYGMDKDASTDQARVEQLDAKQAEQANRIANIVLTKPQGDSEVKTA